MGSVANLLQCIGGQAGLPTTPFVRAPHFVIPAKAGIQRGGGECGKPSSEANIGAQPTIPKSAGPHLRHSGPPSSFRRRPESRGAVRPSHLPKSAGKAFAPPQSSFRRRPESRGAEANPPSNHPPRAPAPHHSSFRRRPESRGAVGNGAKPRPPPVDPPNFNAIRISLKTPIKSSNDLAETPKGREAGKRLTYNSVRSSLIK